jgi:DUF4097 and DUF4098 domain-containing protein YvlB
MQRRRWTRYRSAVPLAALLVAALACNAGAQRRRGTTYSSRVDTTFAFDKNGSVTVSASGGDIAVTGWARDQVHVRAVSDDDNIRMDASSSRMTLDISGSHRGGDTRFEISVPYGVRVTATTRSGEISIHGTRGQIEAHAQDGGVQVEDVASRLEIKTFSGDVTATNVSGDVNIGTISGGVRATDIRGGVDVQTVSGDIDLRNVTSKAVRAKTTSGEVGFEGAIDPSGRYDLSAHSGDIRLHIPRDASAQLTVSTWSGGINSEFPITLKPGAHGIGVVNSKRFTFEIGGGAAHIAAETFSGDVTIDSNGRSVRGRR